jgi:Protein of unknown function (DUF2796)
MVSMSRACGRWPVWGLHALVMLATTGSPQAREGAHEHGVVKLDVAVDGSLLTLQLEAPLDSLLGFEHRPRTEAQRRAADAVLTRFNDGASLFKPHAAALCTLSKSTIGAEALQPNPAAKPGEHADLDATFEFRCAQPDKLLDIDVALFDAFKRIQRINAQVIGPKGQAQRVLKRPDRLLKLSR